MNLENVEKAKKGDKEAFETIIMEVIDNLYRVAYAILQNKDDASDAVSNATLKAYEKISTLKNLEFFKTWITKIVINESNLIVRQNKKIVFVDTYIESQHDSYTNENEISIDVQQAMKDLDKELKNIVILYYFEDSSIDEISNILNIASGTVKSRLARARTYLAKKLLDGYKDNVL